MAAWPAERRDKAIAQADAILEAGLTISDQEGQWIFYYACPADNADLKPEAPGRHVCTKCGKVYRDKRTEAAYQTRLHYKLDADVEQLSLAWSLTGEEKYAVPVRQALLKLARLYPTWTRHDRWGRRGILAVVGGRRYCQHLDEAISVIALARSYDRVAEAPCFDDETRRTIEEELLRRICTEIQSKAWMMEPENNHQTWFNAAYATVGVAIADEGLLRDAVEGPKSGLLWQLEQSVTSDGIWYEGTMAYHFYAVAALIDTLKAVERVGWTFRDNERLKSLWMGPMEMAYPYGHFPVINDSDPFTLHGRQPMYQFAADYFGDPAFNSYNKPQELPSRALKGAGLVALRRGKGEAAKCLFLDYGIHDGHHDHADKLNITLYALGREIVLDPGRLTYSVPEHLSWAHTTVAHNTVVINQSDQKPDEGRLLWFAETPAYAAAIAESSGAYRGYRMRRALVMTDQWLFDLFTVVGEKRATIDLLLHARHKLLEDGKSDKSLGSKNGYQHLTEVVAHAAGTTSFTFEQADKRQLKVHIWPETPVWSGVGIGYGLNDKVPFTLRRQQGKEAAFVTLYDLDESGVTLGEVSSDGDKWRVKIVTEGVSQELQLDMADESSQRLLLRSLP